ncbi:MAG: HYC_CC_PP family protein [Thermaurantimonas sp.]|uniref:HYC_CC_PP family protein n=1 Tax=Thermaurantimonas sp. TaxID=2681568 RepID=UPI00391D154B
MIKILLRKFGALLLTLAMVSAQTGVVISFHYCKGELVESSVYLPVEECGGESNYAASCQSVGDEGLCTTQIYNDCCTTEVIALQADHNLQQSKKSEIPHFFPDKASYELIAKFPVWTPSIEEPLKDVPAGRTVPLYISLHRLIYYG